jgi:ankyrin repeat protein
MASSSDADVVEIDVDIGELLRDACQEGELTSTVLTTLLAESKDNHHNKLLLNARHAQSGDTPLILAAENGHAESVQVLLQARADVNLPDTQLQTALHLASEYGNTAVVRTLLQHRAIVDVLSKDQDTALMRACADNNTKCVKLLLKAKADTSLVNASGLSLSALALQNDHRQLAASLDRYIAKHSVDGGTMATVEVGSWKGVLMFLALCMVSLVYLLQHESVLAVL